MNLRDYKTVKERREALSKALKLNFKNIGLFSLDESAAGTRNCENMIGVAQIPMGIAGPLLIKAQISNHNDQKFPKKYYLPLATTEGALVASVSRGCKAISESGGATVDSYRVGATRGPVFKVKNLEESDKLNKFLAEHLTDLQKVAAGTSHHLKLTKYLDRGVGHYRYIRFVFDTGSAMGMNMVTIATNEIVRFIEEKTGIRCVSLAGNYDTDKKPSWLNIIEGRGIKAWAEVTIPEKVLHGVLKTTAQKVYETWLSKCMLGSAMSGSMGFNSHFANVTAALFLATGQDAAHVTEASLGIASAEIVNRKNLYVSVYLPDLMLGIVGGGTGLGTQKEALSMLGVASPEEFAGVTAGAVLAGEISLLSSLAEGSLAGAHQALARGKLSANNESGRIYE